MRVRTTGELVEALSDYPEDTPLDIYLLGEDRLSWCAVVREGGPESNPDNPDYHWPQILLDFEDPED